MRTTDTEQNCTRCGEPMTPMIEFPRMLVCASWHFRFSRSLRDLDEEDMSRAERKKRQHGKIYKAVQKELNYEQEENETT